MYGLGCTPGGNCCDSCRLQKGMGAFSMDMSTWTWEEWLMIGAGGMMLYGFFSPDSALFTWQPKRRRRGKSDTFGSITASALVLGAVYVGYQYLTGGSSQG